MRGGWAMAIPSLTLNSDEGKIDMGRRRIIPDSSKAEAFAKGLHYDEVGVVMDEGDGAAVISRKIYVCLVDYDETFEFFVL